MLSRPISHLPRCIWSPCLENSLVTSSDVRYLYRDPEDRADESCVRKSCIETVAQYPQVRPSMLTQSSPSQHVASLQPSRHHSDSAWRWKTGLSPALMVFTGPPGSQISPRTPRILAWWWAASDENTGQSNTQSQRSNTLRLSHTGTGYQSPASLSSPTPSSPLSCCSNVLYSEITLSLSLSLSLQVLSHCS